MANNFEQLHAASTELSDKRFSKEFKLSDSFFRTDNPTSNNELSRSLRSTRPGSVDHYNQFMHTGSSNMQTINSDTDIIVSIWVYWKHTTKQIIDLFGSIFHANMVGLGYDFEYMRHVGHKPKQPDKPSVTDQSNESKLGDQQTNEFNDTGCTICGCSTKPCYCEYPIGRHNDNNNKPKWDYTKVRRHLWDSIEQYEQLYRKLGNQQDRGEN